MTPGQRAKALIRAHSRMLELRGTLQCRPCWCGDAAVERHHPDYSDARTVEYLCKRHHRALHRNIRQR